MKAMKHISFLYLVILLSLIACNNNVDPVPIEPDLSTIKIFGDIRELSYPDGLKSNSNYYAQTPIKLIEQFRNRIAQLQHTKEDFEIATVIDSMIVNKDEIQFYASNYKTWEWKVPKLSSYEYLQISEVGDTYYFDDKRGYYLFYQRDYVRQLSDYSKGHIEGDGWNTSLSYDWEKTDQAISFTYWDRSSYSQDTSPPCNVVINRIDLSGSMIQSNVLGWSIGVTWNAEGHGTWVQINSDGTKYNGRF
jgi:hypothetical protein